MGVRKFRSVADMPGPPPGKPLDPANIRQALGLASLAHAAGRRRLPPGVTKYRSWDEALAIRSQRDG